MRTITPKPFVVYEYGELSEDAKKQALSNLWRQEYEAGNPWIDEWSRTLHELENLFDIAVDFDSYNRHSISWRKWDCKEFGDEILGLRGPRAMAYLWNNYRRDISPGKYYGKSVPNENDKEHPVGLRHVKRYSKCTSESYNCPLTGVCYDNDALDPIWCFLDGKDVEKKNKTIRDTFKYRFENWTVKDLIEDCVDSLCEAWENEEEYRLSDEGLEETIRGNKWEFCEDGTLYG